jgi:hypothetical protein
MWLIQQFREALHSPSALAAISPRAAIIPLALVITLGCGVHCRTPQRPLSDEVSSSERQETDRFLARNLPRYREAIARTIRYLDAFDIDPVALRRLGMKGKKKLVELLDAYVSLHRHARTLDRAALLARFRRAAQVTTRADYHDLAMVDDRQFHQDATSYLRACYLMEKMGLDTTAYRREISKIKPRLDAHLPRRGPHQRMVFQFYYKHFGLERPPLLAQPFKETITARHIDPERLALDEVYQLTHEVFVPYDFGGDLNARFFSPEDKTYLRRALAIQAARYLRQRDVDVLGELLACLRYLGSTDLPVYREGLEALLASQRPNGAFGDYERLRARRGALLELDLYLHTTSVAMDILPLAFDDLAVR